MAHYPRFALAAAGALSMLVPTAHAGGHGAAETRLVEILSHPAAEDRGAERFEALGDCRYAIDAEPTQWQWGTYSARTEADFSAAAFTTIESRIADDGSFGAIRISNPDEFDAVTYRTDYSDVPEEGMTSLTRIGSVCDGTECVRSGERDRFEVTVRGDDLATLVETVQADLLAVAAACAPN